MTKANPKGKIEMEQLGTAERSQQLQKIDKLREYGVGEDISLPQLVVVGDQSSGKSSLLEGLTELPFPVASQLCTRFATQVSFRRLATSIEDSIIVTIIPAPDSEDAYKHKMENFRDEFAEFTLERFGAVLNEATKHMGLPCTSEEAQIANKRFSRDVLKIEIVGRNQPHLSVVDVPGLYHNPTKEQTESDLATIRASINDYIGDRRTIILAVLNSTNNLANQEVFRLAKTADPDGMRTIGIMTKLDVLQTGDEPAVIKIALNQTERLKHGWYCVRNRSTKDIMDGVTIQQRHQNEETFFKSPPWNSLPKKHVGIHNLRANLSKLLSVHISKEFPTIEKEIEENYQHACQELELLGPPRQSSSEQRHFLTKLAADYQKHVQDSLNGRYYHEGLHPSKLRMHMRNAADKFDNAIHERGATMSFKTAEDNINQTIVFGSPTTSGTVKDIYKEIAERWRLSRGPELPGLVNPVVLETLFAQQSEKWKSISREHVTESDIVIAKCNDYLLQEVCHDPYIRQKILVKVTSRALLTSEKAYQELETILRDEREGHLFTTNHYLADNLQAARGDRFINGLKRLGFRDGTLFNSPINFQQMKNTVHLSNETSAVYDIHDTLKAYYKVALKRFIDNVGNQIIERILLGPEGLVNIFTPVWVSNLNDEELALLVGEDEMTTDTRLDLNAQIKRLDMAKKICEGRSVD